ncbi:mannosyl-oligosaccharide alpha-1,2-mannosidase IA-like [Tigriopus californicus]|uniref:mannosyl-oligosaccharide alpha-1,2-mannosidase IA-like n=1 Tax=Tigriopus californicus TaxID=6832 RepID=UPI0027DA8691|nr:mannosyl-oligosaccharide alpha-1,2-mannosidase IA-like [Tigriopus californicus]
MPSVLGRGFFRPREKSLILLVMVTFACVCFGAIFFLPEKSALGLGAMDDLHENRVYRVYQELKNAGQDFIIPAPPRLDPAELNPNLRHGVIDRPDPHQAQDKARLLAQIEMDLEIKELRQKAAGQRVLDKPQLDLAQRSSSASPAHPPVPPVASIVIQGGSDADPDVQKRRETVSRMMKHAWDGYAKYSWGKNEVKPVSRRGHSGSIFGSSNTGATIVDGMDTLYIMGFMEEFQAGKEWIAENLNFDHMTGDISVFETNIRFVGGLVSLYSLTGDELFKEKADHVARKLLPAFNTPTGIPLALVNMRTGSSKNFGWASGASSILSEFGSLHMEFSYLSDITGDPIFRQKVEKVRDVVASAERPKGLYPNYLSPKTGKWGQFHTSMGALGDSFYEYLLKEYLRSGRKDNQAKDMFIEAANDVANQLVKISPGGLTYFAEYKYGRLEHKMDHLACFGGGMYALGAKTLKNSYENEWMKIAEGITNTCHESYDRTDTKLGPEAFRFSDAVEARAIKSTERYYILRPETFESYFVLWRLTHDQKYRDWGWEAVQALEKHCKAEGGYTGLKNVYAVDSPKDDVQQSFFLAETLKYLYLLFSDDSLMSLDEWVFNTEAHPLPIMGKNKLYRPKGSNNVQP